MRVCLQISISCQFIMLLCMTLNNNVIFIDSIVIFNTVVIESAVLSLLCVTYTVPGRHHRVERDSEAPSSLAPGDRDRAGEPADPGAAAGESGTPGGAGGAPVRPRAHHEEVPRTGRHAHRDQEV